MAIGMSLAVVFCLSFLLFEVYLLQRIASGFFFLSAGFLFFVAPAWLGVHSWRRGSVLTWPKIGEFIDHIVLDGAGFFLLYIFYEHGGFTGVGVAVLAAAGFLALLAWFAWLIRRRIRRQLRQQLIGAARGSSTENGDGLEGSVAEASGRIAKAPHEA